MEDIGLLGGGFDPVHVGHLAIAETVYSRMTLGKILFIPAAVPPHKEISASFSHRLRMLELALNDREGFEITTMEAEREGPSYTVDTLRILQKKYGSGVGLYFITGFDAFSEIKLWHQYSEVLRLASFVVIDRPSHTSQSLEEFCARELFDVYPAGDDVWQVKAGGKIHRLNMETVPVSSTEIRERLRKGNTIRGLVPEEVEEYIDRHKLYMENGSQ